ncbi:MAG: adenylate/guanylate cyclase domain-containing protein [Novosphingobium sp.]
MASTYRDRFSAWLTAHGAAMRTIPDLLDALCRFFNAEGYEVFRCNLATEAVHPLIANTRHVWFAEAVDPGPINPAVVIERRQFAMGEAMVDEILFNTGSQRSPQYLASPFFKVEEVGELYEPIGPAGGPQPFPVFDDLAASGCTGYYALRLTSFAGLLQKFGLATRRAGGLDAARRRDLRWSLDLFTLHLDTLIESIVKETLARCYVGVDPGRRVCDGMIGRGAIVSVEAAVWFSDLRGFTAIGDSLDSPALVESLNDYFDAVVPPIYAAGGEVLKYIGDAVLAIFPHANFSDAGAACRAALAAEGESRGLLAQANARRGDCGLPELAHGIGLSSGTVSYGNIGSRERLDFTVIGAAVNLASRVEALTRQLDEPVLCSAGFAGEAGGAMRPLGEFALKGLARPAAIFAPAEAA